jgi:hypothetical protein
MLTRRTRLATAPAGGAHVAVRIIAAPHRAAEAKSIRARGPPWFTTLPGALLAMAGAACLSATISLGWWLGAPPMPQAPDAETALLALELALLLGSVVNLVAVVGGCWEAVRPAAQGGPAQLRQRSEKPKALASTETPLTL